MRVYPSGNALATEQFIREVLKYCEGKPTFISGEKGNINIILYNRKYFCRMKKRHLIDMVIGQS